MTDVIQTRKETHYEIMDSFLDSDIKSIRIRLYGSEIKKLTKRYPKVEITIESCYRDSLYNCLISRKQ